MTDINPKVFKLLLMLDATNDNEVVAAARGLVAELKASGLDLRVLADALQAEAAKQHAKNSKLASARVVWSEVDAALDKHVAGKTSTTTNKVLRAVNDAVPTTSHSEHVHATWDYVVRRLHGMGFVATKSLATWQRSSPS